MSELHFAERIKAVRDRIMTACRRAGRTPDEVTLVAVTKTVSVAVATAIHGAGVADLGENRPQELWKKAAAIPQANWHFIGHLQRNKIEKTVPLSSLIHSVDSQRLLEALEEHGGKNGRVMPALLEVNCSRETAKGGFAPEQLPELADQLMSLRSVRVDGLMTMAALQKDPEMSRPVFAELRELRDKLRSRTGLPLPHLSMGMSNDFEIAIEEGATLVRLGSVLFEGLA